MRTGMLLAALLTMGGGVAAESSEDELQVRQSLSSFYRDAARNDFRNADRYAALDWTHVDARGARSRGRDAVLAALRREIGGGVPVIEETTVRFPTQEVAVATVVDNAGQRRVRTFVLVKQKGRWRITQDQATEVQ